MRKVPITQVMELAKRSQVSKEIWEELLYSQDYLGSSNWFPEKKKCSTEKFLICSTFSCKFFQFNFFLNLFYINFYGFFCSFIHLKYWLITWI